MRTFALAVLLAAATLLSVSEASAQWVRPHGVSRAGDPMCPPNYIFDQGWCKPLHGSRRAPRGFDGGSGQWVRPRGVSPAGDPICPPNYIYQQGWCKPLYGSFEPQRRHGSGYRGGYGGGFGGRESVPPRWNHLGSAVCPPNFDFHAQVGACISRY